MKKFVSILALLLSMICVHAESSGRWSINVAGGYMAMSNFSTDVGTFDIGVQRSLSKYFSLGAGTGMYYCDGAIIPIYADFRGYYPVGQSKFSWIGIVRTGVGIPTKGGSTAFGIEGLPGIGYRVTDNSLLHINLGVGSYDSKTMGTIQLGYSHNL